MTSKQTIQQLPLSSCEVLSRRSAVSSKSSRCAIRDQDQLMMLLHDEIYVMFEIYIFSWLLVLWFQELARRLQQEQQTVASERLHVSALTIQNQDLQTELVAANQKIYGGWVSMNTLSLLHALYSYWMCCLVLWPKWTVMEIKYSVW